MLNWQRVTFPALGCFINCCKVWERGHKHCWEGLGNTSKEKEKWERRLEKKEKKRQKIKKKKGERGKGDFVARNPCCEIARLELRRTQRRRSGARRARRCPCGAAARSNTALCRLRCCQNPLLGPRRQLLPHPRHRFHPATAPTPPGRAPCPTAAERGGDPASRTPRSLPGWNWGRRGGFLPWATHRGCYK